MANINFKHGNLTNMPESMTIGNVYFAIGNNNVGKIYFDAPNGQRFLMGEGIPVEENTNIYQINVAQANNSANDLFGNTIHTSYIHDIKPADPNGSNAGKLLITRFNNDGEKYSEAIDLSTVSAGGTTSFTTIHKMFVTSEENQKEFSDSSLDFSDYVSVGVYVNGYKIPHSEISFNENTAILTNPPELIGTEVEIIIVKAIKTNNIVSTINLDNKMNFYKQNTPPENTDAIWVDTTTTPYVLRFYNGIEWEGMNTFQ